MQNYRCYCQLVEPAVLLFDLSTFSKILAKNKCISRIVSVGPGLGIALCCQFFLIASLTWYFVCWEYAIVTVGHTSLTYLVWYRHRWKQLRCITIYRDLPRKMIFWFDLCGWLALCCQLFPLILLTWYIVYWRFTPVTFGRAILPYLVWYRNRWKKLRCKLNKKRLTKENDLLVWSVWLAPNDTWRSSPMKVGSLDPGLSETILDINIYPIRFRTNPVIL